MSIVTRSFAPPLSPLAKEFQSLQIEPKLPPSENKEEVLEASPAPEIVKTAGTAKRLFRIQYAHRDDVHGLIQVGSDTFVSGSKDGSLKLWNTQGQLVRNVWIPKVRDYTGWITALAPFGSNQWMSGTRDGYIDVWDNDGEHNQTLTSPEQGTTGYKCKERNAGRINCLSQDLAAEKTAQYYVGIATQFSLHKVSQPESLTSCTTSANDWVYCIRPLAERKVLVVTGPNLDLYTQEPKSGNWLAEELIAETRSKSNKKQPRPFISDVTFLDGKIGTCALSVFGGSVVLFDLASKKLVRAYKEHKERVWQIANIRPEIFASCSDDKTIKIWDARMATSAHTIGGHVGRVSCLLRMSDMHLVSGSCPDDLYNTLERAILDFWDIRRV